jgi:ubiquinone biosynthesis protein
MSSLSAGFRLVRAGWVLVREGVVAALPGDQLSGLPKLGWRVATMFTRRRALKQDRSDRLAHAVARLGPSYVKLGQFLATRPDVVGNDIALELALLQDKMPTFPRAEAQAAIEASLGRTTGDLYLEFGDAVAAASIAQVHPAEIDYPQGRRKVAVKVIRPGVRRRFLQDLESYFLAARLQEKYIPSSRRLRPVQVTETLAQTTRIEMDLRLEGAALSELGETTKEDPGFRVPDGPRCPDHGMGRRHQDERHRRAGGRRSRSQGDCRQPDPVLPAAHAA